MLTFLGCNNGEPAPKLSAIRRQYKNRDDAMRAAYETGAYSYQQIAKEFGVHFTTVGRIVRQSMKRVGPPVGGGEQRGPLDMIIDLTP